ncbi:MAG: hypothetical protein ABIH34_00255 [Nanoarchaeota archaeon]
MTRKSYFNQRTATEMRDLLMKQFSRGRGLTERILDLHPADECLEVRVRITPGRFFRGNRTGSEASRKAMKHGDLIKLSQPELQREAYHTSETPMDVIARDFKELEETREDEIQFIGYQWRPVQGNDREPRIVPFVSLPEAVRLFEYAEEMTGGITVQPYDDSMRVGREGANIITSVPSRTRKKARYGLTLEHVPIKARKERKAVVWSLRPKYTGSTGEPKDTQYSFCYTYDHQRQESDRVVFNRHDIAAYLAVIKHEEARGNLTPMEMNPFALPSQLMADFYNRLNNNVLIFDPSLQPLDKRRRLHLDEKCILLARAIGVLGHDATIERDFLKDGELKDYDWSIPGLKHEPKH